MEKPPLKWEKSAMEFSDLLIKLFQFLPLIRKSAMEFLICSSNIFNVLIFAAILMVNFVVKQHIEQ